jgi:hypothetical protein
MEKSQCFHPNFFSFGTQFLLISPELYLSFFDVGNPKQKNFTAEFWRILADSMNLRLNLWERNVEDLDMWFDWWQAWLYSVLQYDPTVEFLNVIFTKVFHKMSLGLIELCVVISIQDVMLSIFYDLPQIFRLFFLYDESMKLWRYVIYHNRLLKHRNKSKIDISLYFLYLYSYLFLYDESQNKPIKCEMSTDW